MLMITNIIRFNRMVGAILFVLLCMCVFSCTTTKGYENLKVASAIDLQQTVIDDTLFAQILNELEASKSIDWNNRTNSINENLSTYKSNTEWLLSQYKIQKVFDRESVLLWRKWNPFSSTTAVTNNCSRKTKLNKWKLKDNDKYSILNTLIHERVHSFCLTHFKNQTRETNQCDASYIAGDLAEIIILYRNGIKERSLDKPICPSLLQVVKKYNLITIE